MKRRPTILLTIAVALAFALALAPEALAAAGGGSAGFSGGGGGGGSGGGGHGGGFAIYIVLQLLFRIALLGHGLGALFLIALALTYFMATRGRSFMQRWWEARKDSGRAARRRTAKRERRVELAAAEASEEDPAFAPDVVRASAAKLFIDIQAAWDADDRVALRSLVAPELLAEWERRLDDLERRGWRNRVQPIGEPTVEYVGLENRGDAEGDRVTVRIEAKLRDFVEDRAGRHIKRTGRFAETVRTREFWTLRKRENHWILVSIEQGAEGTHALDQQIVATPWADEQALRDEALVEGAVAEAVPAGTNVSEVADLQYEGDARAAANDLSLADGRFAPDVLEVAARRAVSAWAEAVDGNDAALLRIATHRAARELLHPGDPTEQTRLVVRGPVVKRIRILALDAAAEPPTMTIAVDLQGRRYVEDRDTTAVVSGSQSRVTSFTEDWTLALDGTPFQPWRIVAVDAPVARA